MNKQNEYFYCYSPNVHRFLQERGQRYICVGLNPETHRKFWQYQRTDELNALLDEWTSSKPNN